MYSRRADEAEPLRPARVAAHLCRSAGELLCLAAVLASGCAIALLISAATAQATIYFRSASSIATSSASSLTLQAPSDTTVGDLLILNIDSNGGSTPIPAPSGWTSVPAGSNFSGGTLGGGYSTIAYKVAGAEDVGASYAISLGTTRAAVARIVDYVGVETSEPVENTFAAGTNPSGGASTTSFSYPSVTTTVKNSMVILGAVAFPTGAPTTITPPTGTTVRVKLSATASSPDITTEVVDLLQATAGAVSKTGTIAASSPWGAGAFALKPASSGTLHFDIAPESPTFGNVQLKGEAQKTTATMNDFAVDDTSSESGWNVTVNGAKGTGQSPVFKQYCENGTKACGTNAAKAYVTAGKELAAGSLQLNTKTASWSTTGGAGSAPAFQCSTATCSVDSAKATKIVSTAKGGGLGPWVAGGFEAGSLTLSTPSTVRVLPADEIYRVDLLWTLSSGP